MYMNSLNSELSGVGEREKEMNAFASKLCITVKNSIKINKTKYHLSSRQLIEHKQDHTCDVGNMVFKLRGYIYECFT